MLGQLPRGPALFHQDRNCWVCAYLVSADLSKEFYKVIEVTFPHPTLKIFFKRRKKKRKWLK